MLARASAHIAAHADALSLASRSPDPLAAALGARPIAFDWADHDTALTGFAPLAPVDTLISWLHDDGIWLAEHLEAKLKPQGRSIRIHGADSRDPDVRDRRDPNPRDDLVRQTVILGWVNRPDGRRWLTNDEISDAVIRAVDHASEATIQAGDLDE